MLAGQEVAAVEVLSAADHLVSRAFRLRLRYSAAAPSAPELAVDDLGCRELLD